LVFDFHGETQMEWEVMKKMREIMKSEWEKKSHGEGVFTLEPTTMNGSESFFLKS